MSETTNTTPVRRGVPTWAQLLIWGCLIGLLVTLAMGLYRSQQGTVQPGNRIGNFGLTLYSGYEFKGQPQISLAEIQGKVVLVNFWASWCKPCEQEAASLRAAWEHYKDREDVVFLGIAWSDTEPDAQAYLRKFGITYPNGLDAGERISQQFRMKGVPETYFIDKEGVLRYVQVGPFSSEGQIRAIIDPLLQ